MSETTNENLQTSEETPVVQLPVKNTEEDMRGYAAPTKEAPTTEEAMSTEPKLIGTKVITIKTDIYDNDQQNINITTPDGSSMSENLGMLKIAEHILLKDKF